MRRLALAGVSVFFLGSALLGTNILYVEGWRWWLFALSLGAAIVGVDFLVAACRRRGGWPLSAYFLLEVLTPW